MKSNFEVLAGKHIVPEVILYGDGSSYPNPGPAGYAFILKHVKTGRIKEGSGGIKEGTNNIAELTAILEGLKCLKRPVNLEIVTDSQYVCKGLAVWIHNWKSKGKLNDGSSLSNLKLWQELDRLIQPHQVKYTWVRGHTGHKYNERCDQLAMAARIAISQNH